MLANLRLRHNMEIAVLALALTSFQHLIINVKFRTIVEHGLKYRCRELSFHPSIQAARTYCIVGLALHDRETITEHILGHFIETKRLSPEHTLYTGTSGKGRRGREVLGYPLLVMLGISVS